MQQENIRAVNKIRRHAELVSASSTHDVSQRHNNDDRGRFRIKYGMTPDFMGFTLIELLVVVLIIGILAAVALPQYQKAVEKARAAEGLTILKTIANANRAYYMANGTYPTNMEDLDIEIPGKDTTTVAGKRITTQYFEYGAHAWNDEDNTVIAIAQRIPNSSFYSFNYFRADDTICCYGYSDKGIQVCKTISNGKTNATYASPLTCYQVN